MSYYSLPRVKLHKKDEIKKLNNLIQIILDLFIKIEQMM